jgi:TatD DNase family protein
MLETDSPYLTPEPFRGKKNEPYNIIYVAKKIAEIKDISLEKVLEITTQNAINQFDLKL